MIAIPVIETQKVPINYPHGITLYIKREDKTHVHVSGNSSTIYRQLSKRGMKDLSPLEEPTQTILQPPPMQGKWRV